MRIEITRTGGFAGLSRTWSLEVSRTEAEQRWLPLAEAEAGGTATGGTATGGAAADEPAAHQGSADVPGPPAPGQQRDRFTYRIAIGYTEVHLPEGRLEEPWRELIERAKGAGTADSRSKDAESGKPGELL
ncbi:protealysin inhibitor emfourin [Arthrobacter sp. B1805]|uniref:protealysin inhibitor emfourin n=1 Tax=Arthrobacter sp. B1805 TaxID=2058892 RepID=UPI000CE57C45|nr:protealysin inhibitor emfourin [Arthrobacter sp. B1805]